MWSAVPVTPGVMFSSVVYLMRSRRERVLMSCRKGRSYPGTKDESARLRANGGI